LVYLGIDWAEAHHDVCLMDEGGTRLAGTRVPDGLEGLRRIHELVAGHTDSAENVVVGIETDRGLLVRGLVAAGYQVYAVNPFAVSRYRDRHATSGPSPTLATPRSSPTWSAPTATTTGRSPATASWLRR